MFEIIAPFFLLCLILPFIKYVEKVTSRMCICALLGELYVEIRTEKISHSTNSNKNNKSVC